MDLTQIYLASPDWIKALLVVVPFLTLYGTTRLLVRRPLAVNPVPPSAPAPVTRVPRYLPFSGRSEVELEAGFVDLATTVEKSVRPDASP